MYYYVDAEVPGTLAPGSSFDPGQRAADSGPLHLVFDGWMGDDLVTTSPFWFVTARLADALRDAGLSGFELDPATASEGEQYDATTDRALAATWFRLVPTGSIERDDDLALEGRTELLVSGAALEVLRSFALENADVAPAEDGPPVSPVMERFLAQQAANDEK
ncbi:MAG TPA: hypothetical protein VN241_05075 [Microbacterium sp.]|nr:hypothetical protein [Microbacterium sp.]